jgi:polysaccharide export outer membrane protein
MMMKVRTAWGWAGMALVAALLLGGCKTGSNDPAFEPVPGIDLTPAEKAAIDDLGGKGKPGERLGSYEQIEAGDTLTVNFADLPTATAPLDVRVREDGTITLLLNQTFKAAGKSVGELEREIRERYVPKLYVNLTVSIHVQNVFYFVGGEVKAPGKQQYTGRTTVIRAIQSAGDFTDFAKKTKVKLIRSNGKKILVINVPDAMNHPEKDLEVFPGDKIYVPRRIL